MSTESLLKDICLQLTALNRKVDALNTEKSLNEDPDFITAMSEAKKGNHKALRVYAKKRHEARTLRTA